MLFRWSLCQIYGHIHCKQNAHTEYTEQRQRLLNPPLEGVQMGPEDDEEAVGGEEEDGNGRGGDERAGDEAGPEDQLGGRQTEQVDAPNGGHTEHRVL